ncbi:DUF262 domain-containing protein [Deltaproteobacteria bacterium]|nr:DUF262 domain-containing protein [Deltaproteobacteria bacterium]
MSGTVSLTEFWDPLRITDHETCSLGWLYKRMKGEVDGFGLNLDPDYQREHVWTDEQAEAFIGHVIEGGEVPPIIINARWREDVVDEVLDGKQRITATVRWFDGEIKAELTDGRRLAFADLDAEAQRYMSAMTGPRYDINYVNLSRADVLRLYLRLNRGGTVHTDNEINRVRELLAAEES